MSKTHDYIKGDPLPYHYKYEHMAVTTDCVIFSFDGRDLNVLLVLRGGEPYKGHWAFPGGFLQCSETAEQGALRELKEETALTPSCIEQLGAFTSVNRDPRERVITIAFFALVKHSDVAGGDDAEQARWFPVKDLPELAFDHKEIFDTALERLRRDIHFEPVGFELMDEVFTLPDLQRLYEAILGVKFDRRNFQKKILSLGILDRTRIPDKEIDAFFDSLPDEQAVPDERAGESQIRFYRRPKMINYLSSFAPSSRMSSYCLMEPAAESLTSKPKRPTRAPIEYTFNKNEYDTLKKDGFKLEF